MVADIGGSTVYEATWRMMAFLLDHSLSSVLELFLVLFPEIA